MQLLWAPTASAVFVLACVAPPAQAAGVTPVQKVLEMLEKMKTRGEDEMHLEQKTFRHYTDWATDRERECGFQIKTLTSDIEELAAFIEKADNDVSVLGDEIKELEGEIATMEAAQKDATALREKERAEFLVVQQDYSESVDAVERAIQVLQSQPKSEAQAESLLQQMSATVPGMPQVFAAFLEEKASMTRDSDPAFLQAKASMTRDSDSGAPAVAAYEFQSDPIIDMLDKLYTKFRDELADVESTEANKAHNYNLQMLHLGDTIDHTQSSREEKLATKGKLTAMSGEAKGKLADAKADLAETQKLLTETKATFAVRSDQYEANQKVRKAEVEAIAKAIEIISSPTVADSYGENIKLAQVTEQGASLLQVHSASARLVAKRRASEFLRRQAASLSSDMLASLSSRMDADPFAKVTSMIKSLIAKLKAEAAAESSHKAWCDQQLKANKLKREKKTSEAEKLTAQITQLASQIEAMGKQIEKLIAEQKALTQAMQEATTQRESEKAENKATIKDAMAAQEAVKQALAILREFYSSQESLLQTGRRQPEEYDMKAYKGMQSQKGGILGMLEVILSDFARLEAETTAAEKQAAAEYDSFMKTATADKEAKHDREFKLKLDKDQNEFQKGQLEEDLTMVQKELDRAKEYYEYLEPNCLTIHVSWEERVQRRKEEIEALKQAYGILNGDAEG